MSVIKERDRERNRLSGELVGSQDSGGSLMFGVILILLAGLSSAVMHLQALLISISLSMS